jgi:hypothetical protein
VGVVGDYAFREGVVVEVGEEASEEVDVHFESVCVAASAVTLCKIREIFVVKEYLVQTEINFVRPNGEMTCISSARFEGSASTLAEE